MSDPELLAALRIYAEYTPVSERADTNEILYWHGRYRQQSGDRLLLFGLRVNGEVVGFAEVAWLAKTKIAMLDYMTIEDTNNRNGVFFNFLDLITNYLPNADLHFSYFVTEVLLQPDELSRDDASSLWYRLLRTQGFRSIHAPYFQPPLGSANLESVRKANLLVLMREKSSQMATATYLGIVEAIYRSHYGRWYEPFERDPQRYISMLDEYLARIQVELAERKTLTVNGPDALLPATITPTGVPQFRQ